MLLVEKSGLDPLLVLQAATINPARVLGLDDELGSVETGKLADLVLLHSNPLENIRNTRSIRAVVADGRLFRRDQLHRIRAGRAHDSKSGIR
jgi:imidazolonepropionase-like amidohydrolase